MSGASCWIGGLRFIAEPGGGLWHSADGYFVLTHQMAGQSDAQWELYQLAAPRHEGWDGGGDLIDHGICFGDIKHHWMDRSLGAKIAALHWDKGDLTEVQLQALLALAETGLVVHVQPFHVRALVFEILRRREKDN